MIFFLPISNLRKTHLQKANPMYKKRMFFFENLLIKGGGGKSMSKLLNNLNH